MDESELDRIGHWSEIKLEIIREYAKPYSQILAKQPKLFHLYIDGFAGAGLHVSKETGEVVAGSPLRVAEIEPRFREYHLVELNPKKAAHLRSLFRNDDAVHVHEGDCNAVLVRDVLPTVQFEKFRRAFCLLDPYKLQLAWEVIKMAGGLGTIDLLLNFPMMGVNRGVLWSDPDRVAPGEIERMTRFWGDESWREAAYEDNLFGALKEKRPGNEPIVQAFRKRLKEVAGFEHVPEPIAMRHRKGPIFYYLFFASKNATAARIITSVFKKRRDQKESDV